MGFLGEENSGRTTAANVLKKKGFHKVSINDKVEEFASHLFQEEEMETDRLSILNNVRKRGIMVNKEYWLNLVLISVPDDKNNIVFDDISLDEASNKNVMAYQIYRPDVSTIELPDVEIILNDGSIADFTKKIQSLHDTLLKK